MPAEFDVIVVGGGPGGSTTTAFLARDGYRVLLLDKARFPRDKPCGDAISGKSASVLRELGIQDLVEDKEHLPAEGVLFSSPEGRLLQIPFPKDVDPNGIRNSKKYNYVTSGYIVRREVYDNILFQHAKKQKTVVTEEEFEVTTVLFENGKAVGVKGTDKFGREREFHAKVVVGADGAMSPVAKAVGTWERDPEHWVGSYRSYWTGVTGMTKDIEIHFVEDVLPGYFWIFPLDNGLANVGIGVLESEVKKSKGTKREINMRKSMYELVQNHPMFKERFQNAKELPESRKGWLLPLGSKHRKIHGNGWVLVGDAAALIDPFSGEGIGNAMVSARLAAQTIDECLMKNDVSEAALAPYEKRVRDELDRELQMSYKLQKLGRYKPLLNFVIRKAAKKEKVRNTISQMLADREKKEEFGSAFFYVKLLLT
ncbi:MAG TPA: geranylgeranyl reductase family protein [Candidatus Thermoplasmatota archaeon]|nr:geranylgeranyl reductase family protein [Candidatus Thermoplasmatota archaeon]